MPRKYTPRVTLTCPLCGVAFDRIPSRVKQRNFCSPECRAQRLAPQVIAVNAESGVATMTLHAKDGSVRAVSIFDAEDAAWVGRWRWSLNDGGYVRRDEKRGGKRAVIRLHRALLGLTANDPVEVDHINRDRLDNRRCNLRIVTKAANRQNRGSKPGAISRYRGVTWDKKANRWMAQVSAGKRTHFLGYFTAERDAADAAVAGRRKYLPFAVD